MDFKYVLCTITVGLGLLEIYILHQWLTREEEPRRAMRVDVDELKLEAEPKFPWFMSRGTVWPQPASRVKRLHLWPPEAPQSDRIVEQLMFVPPDAATTPAHAPKLKKILFYHERDIWLPITTKQEIFQGCPVSSCNVTESMEEAADADMVLFHGTVEPLTAPRPPRQVWAVFLLESPVHTVPGRVAYSGINWTITYRHDSEIVYPYGRWVYYTEGFTQNPVLRVNYAANKTKKVAWFVSNCEAKNHRLKYALMLERYIDVDIYGRCGRKTCQKGSPRCLEMLNREYKFYLAFENSNCKGYITEKLFFNALLHNVLPIVMGARPEDYARSAPRNSYIHVDWFKSVKELAYYLHQLDKDDALYNSYFWWKGTGEFIESRFPCRLCAMLHDDFPTKTYDNVSRWWNSPGVCTSRSWRKGA